MASIRRLACMLSMLIMLLPLAGWVKAADASTYLLSPSQDSWVYQYTADQNYGGDAGLGTAIQFMSPRGYTFLKFSIPSYPGERIESAVLSLYQFNGGGYGEGPTAVVRLANNTWDESTITWNNAPTGSGTFLAANADGHSHIGWSFWEFPWDPIFGNTLTLRIGENSSGDQSHNWYSKEYATDPNLRPYLALTTSTIAAPIWQHQGTGEVYRWRMDGTTITGGAYVRKNLDPIWQVVATADFDGDGKVDLVLQHQTSGAVYIWFLDGPTITSGAWVTTGVGGSWSVVAAADLNQDGHPDLLWRNLLTGDVYVWLMNGTTVTSGVSVRQGADLAWTLVGTGDFNRDGQTDFLLYNRWTGDVYVWYMNGVSVATGGYLRQGVDTTWQLVGVGDFSKDGLMDLLWYKPSTGDVYLWFMDGTTITGGAYLVQGVDPAWKLMGPK